MVKTAEPRLLLRHATGPDPPGVLSMLSKWFRERAMIDGRRKVTIVALARKRRVGLWKCVTAGATIEGVVMNGLAGRGY
ncbi:MAG: hypothetical protein P4M00_02820 [Azospirillaceae bacterium]|nr:hypothetical protein [Azospirillaceae bacterium]